MDYRFHKLTRDILKWRLPGGLRRRCESPWPSPARSAATPLRLCFFVGSGFPTGNKLSGPLRSDARFPGVQGLRYQGRPCWSEGHRPRTLLGAPITRTTVLNSLRDLRPVPAPTSMPVRSIDTEDRLTGRAGRNATPADASAGRAGHPCDAAGLPDAIRASCTARVRPPAM